MDSPAFSVKHGTHGTIQTSKLDLQARNTLNVVAPLLRPPHKFSLNEGPASMVRGRAGSIS